MPGKPLNGTVRAITALIACAALFSFPFLLIQFDVVVAGFEKLLPNTRFGMIVAVLSIGFAPVLAVFCLLSAISGHDMFRVIAMLLEPATQPRIRSER